MSRGLRQSVIGNEVPDINNELVQIINAIASVNDAIACMTNATHYIGTGAT